MIPSILISVLVLYTIIAVFALVAADRMIFQPGPSSYSAKTFSITLIEMRAGNSVSAYYLPNPSAGYTILYSHGNAEDLGDIAPVLRELHELGFGVISYDYRGYGRSTGGPPSTTKAIEDAEAVYQHLIQTLHVPSDRIILYGRSVGSGPALELAARHKVGGLILESAFTSAFRVMTRVRLLPFDKFPNLNNLERVFCPVLIVHGMRDQVIPMAHGRRLFDAAREPKQSLWVENADHNDVWLVAGRNYDEALLRFTELVEHVRAERPLR